MSSSVRTSTRSPSTRSADPRSPAAASTTRSTRSRQTPSPNYPQAHAFSAIGTAWTIDTREPLPAGLAAAIAARVEVFDRTYSRFRDDSLVARIATTPGRHVFPADAGPLFDLYRRLYEATGGAVTPLVGRALENLGYDRAYSLRPSAAPAPVPAWDDAFAWDGEAFTTLRPVVLDVGAAGKGYLVDIVAAMLRDAGITDYTIDASGDLVQSGTEQLRIGLEHPHDPTKAIGIAVIENQSLCASATNRRSWGDGLHHVIDPGTGLPVQGVIATWAIADSALLADGLATALFFTEPAQLARSFDFTWVRMHHNGRAQASTDLQGELFQ